ncbi:FG-GAP repeat domain-containing protein [Streptomyces sp. NPDC054835]|uniref:FG-GAP repeat domain-containing protein n=1 Tax=Streptomyces sp. NBC_01268 TaxID=2903806 RepID=UPI002E3786AA|nr:VCBS repeat-containing protein [Streptomyces sp. NBC_01268]
MVALLPQQAAAATVPNGEVVAATITSRPVDPAWKMALTESENGVRPERRTRFAQDIAAVENGGRGVPKVGIGQVVGGMPRVARPLCQPVGAAGAKGFCWEAGEDSSTVVHVPQGLTGSGEAPENAQLVGGRRIVVSSWYKSGGGPIRVTLADVTDPAAMRYRHVLLVTPTATAAGYTGLTGHADSVTWYKNRLYVSTASGMALFDLDRFWRTDPSGTTVGVSGGKYYAAGHDYALPQVDQLQYLEDDPGDCGTFTPADRGGPKPPCFAGASLDLSGEEPALVTTEINGVGSGQQQKFLDPGVIVRWPLDPATGLPRTTAQPVKDGNGNVIGTEVATRPTAAFTSTVSGAQGVAMNRGRFVVSAPCPEFVEGGANIPSCLYHAWPGEPVRLWTRTGVNNENVAYWPATDELWTLNESTTDRAVFSIPWPRPELPLRSLTGLGGDLTGDGRPDVIAVRPKASTTAGEGNGNLALYPGAARGVAGRKSIGTGWDSMRLLTGAGDLTGDTLPDVLAVDGAGTLWLYPGTTGSLGARSQLSTGWGIVQRMTGVGDLTGDGVPDVMAVWNDGTAHLYAGRSGGLGASRQIGTSWDSMRLLTGAGDLTGDTLPDVLAVDGAGTLWLYPGTTGGLGARSQVSTGWGIVRTMAGTGDLTGDGLPDTLAVWADGTARLYAGRSGGLGAATPVDLGWGAR